MARIAFISDEYPSLSPTEGGLASYVSRMAALLSERGHEVHVFVQGPAVRVLSDGGVQVHVIARESQGLVPLIRFVQLIPWVRWRRLDQMIFQIGIAVQLAGALREFERRHGAFDVVQSCDLWFRGLFIRRGGRPRVVRCSWARDAFQKQDGVWGDWLNRFAAMLERQSLRRADVAYAPSNAVASYYRTYWGIPVRVIRPPLPRLQESSADVQVLGLPERFFIHFGQIIPRKGSDLVVEALIECRRRGCDVQVVFAGADRAGLLASYGEISGMTSLGAISRAQVCFALSRAEAAVLPSRIDNLPNTAIEALSLGVPVITTVGSSADEIVENLVSGLVVESGDPSALADAMCSVWLGTVSLPKPVASTACMRDMAPDVAVESFLQLLKRSERAGREPC